jgi:hypothetical protein
MFLMSQCLAMMGGGCTDTHRQEGDPISLSIFFNRKRSLKRKLMTSLVVVVVVVVVCMCVNE